jgi:hypothetical protein
MDITKTFDRSLCITYLYSHTRYHIIIDNDETCVRSSIMKLLYSKC